MFCYFMFVFYYIVCLCITIHCLFYTIITCKTETHAGEAMHEQCLYGDPTMILRLIWQLFRIAFSVKIIVKISD